MHDHNLDDLIIDNIEPQNNKLKSLLTIIALMIVILIVAIILTRILLKTPQNNELVFEQQSEELIAPELKLQETPKQEEAKKEPALSNIVESTKTEPVKEEKSVVEPKISDMKKEPVLSNITEAAIKAPEPTEKLSSAEKAAKDAEDIAYWEAVQAKRAAERKAKEKEKMATVEPAETQKVKVPVVEKPKPVAKPVKKVVVKEPVKKPVTSQPKPESTSTTKYYVQVGSFKTQPSSRIISVIKNNGYRYRILRSSSDGTKKLLIGPYADRVAVNRALVEIKDRINKRAFVVKR